MNKECMPHIARQCVCCNSPHLSRIPAILMPFIAERIFGWVPTEITADWGLRDITLGKTYSLCNTLKCDDCGLIFLDIRFDDYEMSALYSGYRGGKYNALREKYEPGHTIRNQWRIDKGFSHIKIIEAYISSNLGMPGKVLDWGGDTGINTPYKGKVAVHHIFDISDKPVIEGAQRVTAVEATKHTYDLITLMHVLEHIPYPQDTLNDIVKVMKGKETVLYIELPYEELIQSNPTPNISPYQKKRHWHEHVNFYTEQSITCLLESCGLKLIDLSILEVSPSEVTSSKEGYVYSVLCK